MPEAGAKAYQHSGRIRNIARALQWTVCATQLARSSRRPSSRSDSIDTLTRQRVVITDFGPRHVRCTASARTPVAIRNLGSGGSMI